MVGVEITWWHQLLSDHEEFGTMWLIKAVPSCGDLDSLLQKPLFAAIGINCNMNPMAETEKGNSKWLHTNSLQFLL